MDASDLESISAQITAVVNGWQNRLLQLDRRNNLLNFRPGRSAVRITNRTPDDIFSSLLNKSAGLRFDYEEPVIALWNNQTDDPESADDEATGSHFISGDLIGDYPVPELQRRLRNLMRRANEFRDEQGLSVLYLALGMLEWEDIDGHALQSPLLLLPCELDRSSPRSPFTLRCIDDVPVANSTLSAKLRNDFGIELPDLNFDEETPGECLGHYRRALSQRQHWTVNDNVYLSVFSYSKLAMWHDLESIKDNPTGHDMVATLAGVSLPKSVGDADRLPPLPSERDLAGGGLDDLLKVRDQFAVLPADFSQLVAIKAVVDGHNLVIYGPPGTGKSQTIANIIATSLAQGKTVLFVSEKNAALDVVKNRLDESQLGGFCLDLHGERGNKSNFYQQLKQAVDDPRRVRRADFPFEDLEQARQKLNDYVRALHEERHPLGMSAFSVLGRLTSIRETPHIPFPVDNIQRLDRRRLASILSAADRILVRDKEFKEHQTSPWRALRSSTPSFEVGDTIRADMQRAVGYLEGVITAASELAGKLDLPAPHNFSGVATQAKLALHLSSSPGVPRQWLETDQLKYLTETAVREKGSQSARAELLCEIGPYFGNPLRELNYDQLSTELEAFLGRQARLDEALHDSWRDAIVQGNRPISSVLRQIRDSLSLVLSNGEQVAEFLSVPNPTTWSDLQNLAVRSTAIEGMHLVPNSWLTAAGRNEAAREIQDAKETLEKLEVVEAQILSQFQSSALEAIDDSMIRRFRTDHQSKLRRIFGGGYRADRRTVRSLRRVAGSTTFRQELQAVSEVAEFKELTANWDSRRERLATTIGDRMEGRRTDWDAVMREISKIDGFLADAPSGTLQFSTSHEILVDPSLIDRLSRLGKSLEQCLATSDRLHSNQLNAQVGQKLSNGSLNLRNYTEQLDEVERIVEGIENVVERSIDANHATIPEVVHLNNLLQKGSRVRRLEEENSERRNDLRLGFGTRFRDFDTDWTEIEESLHWTRELVGLGSIVDFSSSTIQQVEQPGPASAYREIAEQATARADRMWMLLESLKERYDLAFSPFAEGQETDFDHALQWLKTLESEADSAGDWLTYQGAVSDLDNHIGSGTTDQIREATDDSTVVPLVIERRMWTAWLDWLYSQEPDLARFGASEHASQVDRFRDLDKRLVDTAQNEIRKRVFQSYPDLSVGTSGTSDLAIMRRELSKQRRQWSVRRLLQNIPRLVQVLKPCFLVSPLAVSQSLPPDLDFDVVIFDEASQIFPEDAIPAVRRGKQVIFAGDQKQLPPSNFFRAQAQEEEGYDEDGDDEPLDRLAGQESILDAAIGLAGSVFSEAHLSVHYRSKHDSLIRFSNHYYYDDRLLTFPSPSPSDGNSWDGVHDIHIPEGRYDAGATRTNRAEAERVTDLVFEHMRSRPAHESLGVVALSRAQADHIDRLIENRRLNGRDVDQRFAADLDEPFFVKNLENVQGDERDRIIVSIGYGPTEESGATPNRFGPLNAPGGERRLNVVVSRARRRMDVVHSLLPSAITSDRTGPRMLKRYLEYAEAPNRAIEGQVTVDPQAEPDSPFEESVERALLTRGYRVHRQVGVAGYRIDLAIMSEDSDGYDLGIECDGWQYHSAPAARDRDWQRQQVLQGLGWRILRIWSTAWAKNPDAEIRRIEEALLASRSSSKVADEVPAYLDPAPVPDSEEFEVMGPEASKLELEQYQKAPLPRTGSRYGIAYESDNFLTELVGLVVRGEGPVHIEAVLDRIRECYYPERLSATAKGKVLTLIGRLVRQGTLQRAEDFVWANDEQLERQPRTPCDRKIEYVPPGELRRVVVETVRAVFGTPRSELVKEVARVYGFARSGAKITSAISLRVEELLDAELLVEEFGRIRAAE